MSLETTHEDTLQITLASTAQQIYDEETKERPHDIVNLEPASPEKQEAVKAVGIPGLFRYSTKFEILINIVGLIAAVVSGAAQPLVSILTGNLTNIFVNFGTATEAAGFHPSDTRQIRLVDDFKRAAATDAAAITYIGIGVFALTFVYMYIWVRTGEAMAKRIREMYLSAILRQDIAFFDHVGAGEVATRIQTDTHLFQQGTSEKVAIVAHFLGSFFSGFTIAYVRSWRLALACSSILPCISIMGGLMNTFISKYMHLGRAAIADGGTIAEEVIATIRTAQAFGSQKTLATLYDKKVHDAFTVDLKAAAWNGFGISIFSFVHYASYALIFSFGTTLVLDGHADAGAAITVLFSVLIGSFSLAMVAPEMQAVSHACGAASKLFATIDRVPPIDTASAKGMKPEKVEGVIEFDNVTFNYPSRPDVRILKDLSIRFEAGRTAALVGASGSGKSTIVSLVERFYDPLEGAIKLDGQDLRTLNVKWLRSQIGFVSQEPTLFATTIAGNVAHGLINTPWENVTDEEKLRMIKEACVKANADGFISKLPDGYETMVGERGFLLSGGQKQRLAIARAIVSDPHILLLDEATSALDTESEGVVQSALEKAAAGRTTITVAHRLSTIKDADRIFVMGEGLVLEEGTHTELLARKGGAYARLVQAQKLREGNEHHVTDEDTLNGHESAEGSVIEPASKIRATPQEEVLLKQRETGSNSLASGIMKDQQADRSRVHSKHHSVTYLFRRMGVVNRDMWWMYLVGSGLAVITGLVYPAFGILYGEAIQAFQLTDRHQLRIHGDRNALWSFLIAIISAIALFFQNYFFACAASHLTFKLRSLSFRAILRQDIQFFDNDQNSTGSLTSKLSDNPQKINGLAGITLGAIVQSTVCLIGASVVGLVYGWKLALIGIACIPLIFSAGYIRLRVVVLKDQANKAAHEASGQLACEAAAAIRTVASLTREDECCRLYSASLLEPLRRSNRSAFSSNLLYSISQAMALFVTALVFWYGSGLVASGEYGTRQFFVCLMATIFGAIQAGNLFFFVPDMSSAHGAANDIINLLDSTPGIDAESSGGEIPKNVQGHIQFENVYFRYPTRPDVGVLRSLNFNVKSGTYAALVGASGSGKSTVIQLIERFYDPVAGKIYLDNQLISDLNVTEYRRQIALVSQEPTLYAGTIRFNILLGSIKPMKDVTQAELEAVCRDANILSFIESLPDGFETQVGGKGSQLSGGQKQRIAIARALLRNPKVLLLDEATSALDSSSEKIVQEALDQASKGRTTIAVAHRLSTIQNADCIYFIKDGRVCESGTHDQLLAQRGGYYEHVQLQTLNKH